LEHTENISIRVGDGGPLQLFPFASGTQIITIPFSDEVDLTQLVFNFGPNVFHSTRGGPTDGKLEVHWIKDEETQLDDLSFESKEELRLKKDILLAEEAGKGSGWDLSVEDLEEAFDAFLANENIEYNSWPTVYKQWDSPDGKGSIALVHQDS